VGYAAYSPISRRVIVRGGGGNVFIDWTTISFGRLEQREARDTIYNHFRAIQKVYKMVYTMQTFGSLSLVFPGRFWQSVNEPDGISLMADVCHWCATAHISRCDFAHDWNMDIVDATKIWWAVSTLKNVLRLEGEGGKTWYIGSRESARFARLYDKRAEIKARTGIDVGFPILRFEFEAKSECAPEYYAHYLRCPDVVQSDVAKRYNLSDFMSGSSTDVIRVRGLPQVDPFAFIHQFRKAITKARNENSVLFDELCPLSSVPPSTAKQPDGPAG
jgi:hypothetical protein